MFGEKQAFRAFVHPPLAPQSSESGDMKEKGEKDFVTEDSAEAHPAVVTDDEEQETIRLPIDDHEEAILENIRNHRVTIIHGETGCGKSSRVPVMLLKAPPPDGSLRKVRFFISQPRRIAAAGCLPSK